MDADQGRIVGENAVDAVAVVEEHYPGASLVAVQTTVVVKYKGQTRMINVIKERA